MDVHTATISVAVRDAAGKLIMESVIETKASTILQFIRGLRGDLHVTFEEGTWAAWLYDLLKPYVTNVVVCNPRRNALLKAGSRCDRIDARKLAELLRTNLLRPVYHGEKGPAHIERIGPGLSDHQQRSQEGHEQGEGDLSRLGHSLWRQECLRAPPSRGMAEQDHPSQRAPAGRAFLPANRPPCCLTQTSAAKAPCGGQE